MAHFKILHGDLPNTTALLSIFGAFELSAPRGTFTLKTDTYNLKNNIALLEKITEENKNKLFAKAGWGTLGELAFGPAGLLAGLLLGGHKKYITIAVQLKTQEKFIAECDTKTYKKFYNEYLKSFTESDTSGEVVPTNERTSDIRPKSIGEATSGDPSTATCDVDPAVLMSYLKILKDHDILTEEEYKDKAKKIVDHL
ncbi:hypothetical protein C3L57_05240 [Veillonellaceae bacterium M2-8]|nr:hypothetical protein [Veillonellaceae bacterium M2-8]